MAEIYVVNNQDIAKGDPIFKLEDYAQKAHVEAARADIAEAQASLRVAETDLAEAKAILAEDVALD